MSPSASLAHYKSNLDPPPVYNGGVAPLGMAPEAEEDDPMRTPRKRGSATQQQTTTAYFGQPVTPRRLVFPTSLADSPFRTPVGGLGASTPGSRIYDPHDPRTLLDEELNRISGGYDSPAGLFGKGRGSLLYDSPEVGLDSPGKWSKWW